MLDATWNAPEKTGVAALALPFGREQQNATTLSPGLDRLAGGGVTFAGSGEERPPIVERAAGWNG